MIGLLLVLLLSSPDRVLRSVEIPPSKNTTGYVWSGMSFTDLSRDTIHVTLDVGETLETQMVRLHPSRTNANDTFRVDLQYETSLSVEDEGPHIDLLEWKHFLSEPIPMQRHSSQQFKVPLLTVAQRQRFPAVTRHEIVDEVHRLHGKYWADRVRKVKGPNDYPCSVNVSRYWITVSVRTDGQWRTITVIEFKNMMGC